MKLRIFGLMILLIFCFGIVGSYAEEQKPQLYYLYDVVAKPAKYMEYESAIKQLISAHTKHGFPFPYSIYSTNDFHYFVLIPISNYASIDEFLKAANDVSNKMGEDKYQELMGKFAGTFKYERIGVYTHRPDLSYTSEVSELKPEDINFYYYHLYYVEVGKQQDMEKIVKEWIKLYRTSKANRGWDWWVGGLGSDMPYFCAAQPGKSASDYFNLEAKDNELQGQENEKLWEKTMSLCRNYEMKIGRPRPDLSYTPKTK